MTSLEPGVGSWKAWPILQERRRDHFCPPVAQGSLLSPASSAFSYNRGYHPPNPPPRSLFKGPGGSSSNRHSHSSLCLEGDHSEAPKDPCWETSSSQGAGKNVSLKSVPGDLWGRGPWHLSSRVSMGLVELGSFQGTEEDPTNPESWTSESKLSPPSLFPSSPLCLWCQAHGVGANDEMVNT